ncbi:MAG: nuclear transport factor 2 family protein [bacterium]|nr:nuclear transport factor 2 family protein [bacterium]
MCLAVLAGCAPPQAGDPPEEAVRRAVANYVRSVDNADTDLAREVWADAPDISFIHPLGHERGWMEIKRSFYEKLMRDSFSSRELTVRDLVVKVYGDAAVAEFYWVFNATWRRDGSALRTEGRETQVLRKGSRATWELVHVHYSGMPVAHESQGF